MRSFKLLALLGVLACGSSTAPNGMIGKYNLSTFGGVALPSGGWASATIELKSDHYVAECNGLGCDAGTWSDANGLTLTSSIGRKWQVSSVSGGKITIAGDPWVTGSTKAMVFAR